ncbi:MAG: DMT family transporter [Euryarchaeota archaeon]|nr:DMT family transporter [Euryarchaeota archaeon]
MRLEIPLLGLAIILMWGLWGFLYKYGIDRLGLFRALFVTNVMYMLSNLVILAYLYHRGVDFSLSPPAALLMLGTVLGVGASLLFMLALERYPGSIVIPLTALYPAVSAVLAVLVLGEKIKAVNALGIVLAILAGYLLTR